MTDVTKNAAEADTNRSNKKNGSSMTAPSSPTDPAKDANEMKDMGDGWSKASPAKDLASQVAHQAKEIVHSQVAHRQEKSAGELNDVAVALHRTSRQLEGNVVAPYVEKAAAGVERVSELLRTTNTAEVKGAVEQFARREPLLFFGGAFALGILGARFLKSSSHPTDAGTQAKSMQSETRFP